MVTDAAMLAERPARGQGYACAMKAGAIKANPLALLVPAGPAMPNKPVRQPPRIRAGSRVGRSVFATRGARLDFLDALARTGDPALAAEQMGISLVRLFRLRAEDANFAADWHAAIGFAWERVENRVLAHLLQTEADKVDSKVTLAIMARRDAGIAKVQGARGQGAGKAPIEPAGIARLRAELRALAGPNS